MKTYDIGQISLKDILKRDQEETASIADTVSEIIEKVKTEGDEALRALCARFDGWDGSALEVTEDEIQAAFETLDSSLLDVMRTAAENIRAYHAHQVRSGFVIPGENGTVLGQMVIPIEKVGLYVPGGTAAYPSTVLMDAIPAKLAGCPEIVITTPAKGGAVPPAILAAARIAGVTHIYKVGGAQAIAALAFGTQTIPKVDKIVGPGNAFVAEAKRQVYGMVSIDMIAGPSEILIIADEKSNPEYVAADLLSQAEHDKMASAVLITTSAALASAVSDAVARQLQTLPRVEIAAASIENNGKIILVKDLDEAVDISNQIAPEHLELCVDDPFALIGKVKNAGSVFMGRFCPEALGDYLAGPNHTLPTSGTARFSNPLSVDDFVKKTQFTYYTREALDRVAAPIAAFARSEGLEAHARSALIRSETEKK